MTIDATAAASTTPDARQLSEQVHFLTTRDTRALLVGLAALEAAAGVYPPPSEGTIVRDLLDVGMVQLYKLDKPRFEDAVRAGRRKLAERDEARDKRRAELAKPPVRKRHKSA